MLPFGDFFAVVALEEIKKIEKMNIGNDIFTSKKINMIKDNLN